MSGNAGRDGTTAAGDAPPPPPPSTPGGPLLRRSKDDRVLFGVAGGLGRYLGVDPVVVRVAFVLLALFGGSGVLLYLIGLLAIPEERPGDPVQGRPATGVAGNAAAVIGVVLVVVGAFGLLRQLVPGIGDLAGPLLLVLLGVLVILAARR